MQREPMPARDALGRRVRAECDAMCARFVNAAPPTIRTALTDFATAKIGNGIPSNLSVHYLDLQETTVVWQAPEIM